MASTMSTDARNGETSPPRNGLLSWLRPKRSDKSGSASLALAKKSTGSDSDISIAARVEGDLKPVPFLGLFRSVIVTLLSLVYN